MVQSNSSACRLAPASVVLASTAFAFAVTLQTGRPAMAGNCTPSPVSSCSGPATGADTTQAIIDAANPVSITTDAGFGLGVTGGGYGFDIFGLGGVTFTDDFMSTITTDGHFGILVENDVSGTLSIVSTGSLIATGANGEGLRTLNFGADTLVRAHNTEGTANGINVSHDGSGAIHVVSTGSAIGHSATGISVYGNTGTSLTIEAADTQGATEGIYGVNRTSGAMTITSTGLASGTALRGILADNHIGSTDVRVDAADTHGGIVGIGVNTYGTGSLEINSTGTATGDSTAGLSTYAAASSTSTTINAVDTVGGGWGIYAIHEGSGPITVTSSGTAIGHAVTGIFVETLNNSSTLEVAANHARGAVHGIQTVHGSAAGLPGNTASIVVTGQILGGTGYGIATESLAGVLTSIAVQAGSVVGSNAGNGISNNAGDSNVVIADGGTVNGRVSLGLGSDTLTLSGGFSGLTVLDGGGGGTDTLNMFDANHATKAGGDLQNWSAINLRNTTLTLTGGSAAVGTPGDMTTGIFLHDGSTLDGSQDNFALAGNLALASGTRFIGSGSGSGTNTISGNVSNAGLISTAGGGAGDLVTIAGDYAGNGGTIALEARLGDDTSTTDKIAIGGNTSGISTVRVLNANGLGAATNEGIEIISVAGVSDGVFSLLGDYHHNNAPVVVAGAYAYRLVKGNSTGTEMDNWYLRSSLYETPERDAPLYQAGVPIYEAYAQVLLGMNTISTLQQRVGNRSWLHRGDRADDRAMPGLSSAGPVSNAGAWVRIEGAHHSVNPRISTSHATFDQDIFKAQAGIDGPRLESAMGALEAGLTSHYSQGRGEVQSVYGDGHVSSSGYGLGGSLTWYGRDGAYVDGQAQASWSDSSLSSVLADTKLVTGNDAFAYALSLEGGRRVPIGEGWSVTPQAQMVYSHVDFDQFLDVFGAAVRLDTGASLQARLGLAVARETTWQNANGKTNRAYSYGIANIYRDLLDGTRVDVSGEIFRFDRDIWWGGLGVGGTYSWDDDAFSIYAEGLVDTSLASLGDSYSVQGKAGGRMTW